MLRKLAIQCASSSTCPYGGFDDIPGPGVGYAEFGQFASTGVSHVYERSCDDAPSSSEVVARAPLCAIARRTLRLMLPCSLVGEKYPSSPGAPAKASSRSPEMVTSSAPIIC